MRAIDADALTEILTTAIRNMDGMAKFIGCEDDPEIKMEIKAYRDILNGVKEQPTIEPERLKGHWIPIDEDSDEYECDVCRTTYDTVCGTFDLPYFCPHCGADMRGDQDETD